MDPTFPKESLLAILDRLDRLIDSIVEAHQRPGGEQPDPATFGETTMRDRWVQVPYDEAKELIARGLGRSLARVKTLAQLQREFVTNSIKASHGHDTFRNMSAEARVNQPQRMAPSPRSDFDVRG